MKHPYITTLLPSILLAQSPDTPWTMHHVKQLEGDDNTGRELPDGVFFVTSRASEYSETREVLLARHTEVTRVVCKEHASL